MPALVLRTFSAHNAHYSFHFRHAASRERTLSRERSLGCVAPSQTIRAEIVCTIACVPHWIACTRSRRTIRVCGDHSTHPRSNRGSTGSPRRAEDSSRSSFTHASRCSRRRFLIMFHRAESSSVVGVYARLGDPLSTCPV